MITLSQAEGQSGVGARAQLQPEVGLSGVERLERVYDDQLGAGITSGLDRHVLACPLLRLRIVAQSTTQRAPS